MPATSGVRNRIQRMVSHILKQNQIMLVATVVRQCWDDDFLTLLVERFLFLVLLIGHALWGSPWIARIRAGLHTMNQPCKK
eukprot:1606135-Amphidinium_carterae.1